ncbi:efflux RND transporter permease subunit [Thalassotalea sp. M1531]|uniref:Efflux RND transporter permease subunit n=1 Tax=Thalassotalea algicola TaxID=2716224 RepID=A0A7Y0Q619_9GAMM|nr:CusA/CzcA family heavy metal efflux RND transporter [Thalassotalea algicola]NMP31534.1 efflux RND transporter permease subunit [Thalassotalea algicola]
MLATIIRFSLVQRAFTVIVAILIIAMGTNAWFKISIDAFPDISPTQVKIILKAPGMTTTEIEAQVTRIIETELLGIPSQETLRSTTKYAITDITIDFNEGTDIYWARQQVNERLMNIWPRLPNNITGGIAPMSTPLSEMFMFTVDNPNLSLQQRREILDWQIRPLLRTVPGVADVNSLGGFVKTYEIAPDVLKMQRLDISFSDINHAILENNLNGGIGRINKGNDNIIVRTQGRFEHQSDIENLIVKTSEHYNIKLSDVAIIQQGHLTRYGAVSHNGTEAVQGLVIALKNSNTANVVNKVKTKLEHIQPTLPEGTTINVFYDRANLIKTAIGTISNALVQAVILVIILLALFLGNIRAALVVSLSLPLAALTTFILMSYFGLSANLMSLGGLVIAIGMLVDSSVVVVENTVNRLSENQQLPKLHTIYRASKEVAIPTVSGTLIVVIVFSPLLTLAGLEGKLFTPVALTIVFAMLSALVLSLTVIPVCASFLLRQQNETTPKLIQLLQRGYQYSLEKSSNVPMVVISLALVALISSGILFTKIGKSFMPTLDEGDVIVQLEKSPSITLQASLEIDKQVELALLERIPEVVQIVARTGSDELGLDPMGLNETDVFMELLPPEQWRFSTKQELIEAIRQVIADYPGMNINFTQPIQMRISEMLTGSTGDVSIKVFGDNVSELAKLAENIATQTSQVSGSKDIQSALIEGGKFISIELKPAIANKYGMTTRHLTDYLINQLEGRSISEIIEVNKFTPIRMATSATSEAEQLTSINELANYKVLMPDNTLLPLSVIATLQVREEPLLIERETGKRFVSISTNVENRDVVGFVEELKTKINQEVKLPNGYTVSFGGEFENQQRAMANLMIVIPVALMLIFIILFTTFRSISLSGLIVANIPFALMGGVFALYISEQYLSIPASVGFIALLGVAVLNGIVMVSYFEQNKLKYPDIGTRVNIGAVRRLRPVLMTATTAMFGLMPLVFATGPGAEIQQPLAIVVIGGLVSSTITTLYLLPIFYRYMESRNV